MKIFDFFIKKRTTETHVICNAEQNATDAGLEKDTLTLLDLANSVESFWKFSRSSENVPCAENLYAHYIPGEIVTADDKFKFLSFVPSEYAGVCSMYGDQLTEFNFDIDNKSFQKIAHQEVRYYANTFHEYDAKQLLVKQNYSLEDLDTIRTIIQMGNAKSIRTLVCNPLDPYGKRYEQLGFYDTRNFLKYIWDTYDQLTYDNDVTYVKSHIDDIIRDFTNNKVYTNIKSTNLDNQILNAKNVDQRVFHVFEEMTKEVSNNCER